MSYGKRRDFYRSQAWKETREAYLRERAFICERCGEPADTVHHIKPLTDDNVSQIETSLGRGNLMAVCRDCHAVLHRSAKRFTVDESGRVSPL